MEDYHDAEINECACSGVAEFIDSIGDEVTPRIWRLECPLCGFRTAWCDNPWEAIDAWNGLTSEVYV